MGRVGFAHVREDSFPECEDDPWASDRRSRPRVYILKALLGLWMLPLIVSRCHCGWGCGTKLA